MTSSGIDARPFRRLTIGYVERAEILKIQMLFGVHSDPVPRRRAPCVILF